MESRIAVLYLVAAMNDQAYSPRCQSFAPVFPARRLCQPTQPEARRRGQPCSCLIMIRKEVPKDVFLAFVMVGVRWM